MIEVTILGSGAAPGVPAISYGFGECNPNNIKNFRTRTTTHINYNNTKFLIDTSPDLRTQLLASGIRELDGVLYTHSHADHLHGIDDLREINRVMEKPLNIYASTKTMKYIKKRFDYLISTKQNKRTTVAATLVPNTCKSYKPFYINNIKIVCAPLLKHISPSFGYIFNDGEVVYIADCKAIDQKFIKHIKTEVKLLILPLTNIEEHPYHLGLEDIQEIIKKINPKQTIINHMSTCCDYDIVNNLTQENVFPAYDGMKVEIK